MGRQKSQIEVIQQHISTVDRDISLLQSELGMLLLHLPHPIIEDDLLSHFQALDQQQRIVDELEKRITHLHSIDQHIITSTSQISTLKDHIQHNTQLLHIVYARIGVIAWEESSSDVLSDAIKEILPTLEERQKQLGQLIQTKEVLALEAKKKPLLFNLKTRINSLVASYQLKKSMKERDEYYVETGKAICESHSIRLLESEKATELDQQYNELSQHIRVWQEEIALIQKRIKEERGRLVAVGVHGSIERKIEELQSQLKEEKENASLLAQIYAQQVCRNQSQWEKINFSEEILSCYDQIQRHERIRLQLNNKIEQLKLETQIGECISLIEQDEQRIRHIRQTIEQHNRQISEIQHSIAMHREQIGSLKRALSLSSEQKE